MPQIKVLTSSGAFDLIVSEAELADANADIDNANEPFITFGKLARIAKDNFAGYIDLDELANVIPQGTIQNERGQRPTTPPGRQQGGF